MFASAGFFLKELTEPPSDTDEEQAASRGPVRASRLPTSVPSVICVLTLCSGN